MTCWPITKPCERPERGRVQTESFGSRTRRAFTLAETVVSVGILSIIMSGLMSALLLATRALPQPQDPAIIAPDADAALEMILSDLMLASTIGEDTQSIKVRVPDRTGDAAAETVVYTLKDPDDLPTRLTMSINGGTPRPILDQVRGMRVTSTTVGGDRSLITVELVTGIDTVHRASSELLRRPE